MSNPFRTSKQSSGRSGRSVPVAGTSRPPPRLKRKDAPAVVSEEGRPRSRHKRLKRDDGSSSSSSTSKQKDNVGNESKTGTLPIAPVTKPFNSAILSNELVNEDETNGGKKQTRLIDLPAEVSAHSWESDLNYKIEQIAMSRYSCISTTFPCLHNCRI